MSQDNVRRVIFKRGDENRIVIEGGKFRELLFQQQYLNAMRSYLDLCLYMSLHQGTKDMHNIISFCGDRGEGKSSCMHTMRRILRGEQVFIFNSPINGQEAQYHLYANQLNNYPVYALDVVDPSFFDENHNILDLVISQIYQEAFRDDEKEKDSKERYRERAKLLECFNRVKESMSILEKERREVLDNIEDLDRLGESQQLRGNISNLFTEFLKYINRRNQTQDEKILICIDDLDLNITGGYTMLEQIRKYLSNEHCVILIALKIEQMTKVVQNALYENSGRNDKIITSEMCRDMAEKYITKMFPTEHRVIMPTVNEIVNYRLVLHETYVENSNDAKEWTSIKEAVVSQIFLKTRYLFYNTDHEVNRIIPRNLRSLRHLLAMLLRMEDFVNGSLQSKINQGQFKKYFYNEWTTILPEDQQALVQELINYSDVSTKNHYVLTSILSYIKADKELFEWLTPKVRGYNISVGDVLYVIQYLQETGHAEIDDLLFFIHSYYSMMLYEYYDELVGEVEGADDIPALYEYQKYKWDADRIVVKKQSVSEHREIYANDERFRDICELQQLVGGSYFTYEPGELLPVEPITITQPYNGNILYTSMPRDLRGLDARTIFAFMRRNIKEGISVIQRLNSSNLELLSFRLCEFIALTTKMTQTADESRNGTYRNRTYPYYLSTFKPGNTVLEFDIMAIFSNIINLRFAYDRFSEAIWNGNGEKKSFFDIAMRQEGSLLRTMLDTYISKANEKGYEEPLREACILGRFASAGIIRNVDVHHALLAKVRAEKENVSKNKTSGSSYLGRIIDFYKTIYNSEITLYGDADSEFGSLYTINYEKILKPITDLLELIKGLDESVFSKLFRSYEEIAHPKHPQGFSVVGGGRTIEIPEFQKLEIPDTIDGKDALYLKAIYKELTLLDWSESLDGDFIKEHISDELRDLIPSRVRQSLTKRHKFASPDLFIKRVMALIDSYRGK